MPYLSANPPSTACPQVNPREKSSAARSAAVTVVMTRSISGPQPGPRALVARTGPGEARADPRRAAARSVPERPDLRARDGPAQNCADIAEVERCRAQREDAPRHRRDARGVVSICIPAEQERAAGDQAEN